jgi:hypothetical protein
LSLSILILAIELTYKKSDYAVKCLLMGIIKVKVEIEKRLIEKSTLKILNNSRAENRLTIFRNAIKL